MLQYPDGAGLVLVFMWTQPYTDMHVYDVGCSWVGLVSKNYEIERACMDLEAEVQELEHKSKKLKKWNLSLTVSRTCSSSVDKPSGLVASGWKLNN